MGPLKTKQATFPRVDWMTLSKPSEPVRKPVDGKIEQEATGRLTLMEHLCRSKLVRLWSLSMMLNAPD